MKRLIAWTLDQCIQFERDGSRLVPTADYGRFVEVIPALRHACTIITFNYDIALDVALISRDVKFSYCLDQSDEGSLSGAVRLLKLHGSVNWAVCGNCGGIFPVTSTQGRPNIHSRYHWGMLHEAEVAEVRHCDRLLQECFIVPPSRDKSVYRSDVEKVWRQAAKVLIRRFYVFDPSIEVHERFKALLGPGARARFAGSTYSFAQAASHLRAMADSGQLDY